MLSAAHREVPLRSRAASANPAKQDGAPQAPARPGARRGPVGLRLVARGGSGANLLRVHHHQPQNPRLHRVPEQQQALLLLVSGLGRPRGLPCGGIARPSLPGHAEPRGRPVQRPAARAPLPQQLPAVCHLDWPPISARADRGEGGGVARCPPAVPRRRPSTRPPAVLTCPSRALQCRAMSNGAPCQNALFPVVGKAQPEKDPNCQWCELTTTVPSFPVNKCVRCLRGNGVGPTGKVRGARACLAAPRCPPHPSVELILLRRSGRRSLLCEPHACRPARRPALPRAAVRACHGHRARERGQLQSQLYEQGLRRSVAQPPVQRPCTCQPAAQMHARPAQAAHAASPGPGSRAVRSTPTAQAPPACLPACLPARPRRVPL